MKKIKKIFFASIYHFIGKHLPVSYSFVFGKFGKLVRRMCAKRMIAYCGTNVNIEKGAVFSTKSTIGDNSGIGINASLGEVHIGNNVLMGKDCICVTQNHGFIQKNKLIIEQGYTEEAPIYIGNDVWIGHRVTILPGVHIADGCVIGAGAVVTKNTEPYCVYGGNPARKIKERQ